MHPKTWWWEYDLHKSQQTYGRLTADEAQECYEEVEEFERQKKLKSEKK